MTRDSTMLKVILACAISAAILPLVLQFSFLSEAAKHDISVLGSIATAISGVLIASPAGLSAEGRMKYLGQMSNQGQDGPQPEDQKKP